MAYRFESGHRHQTNIIRTWFSLWEMGSDYLFSLAGSRKAISETVSSSVRNQNPEAQEKRNGFRRILLWIRTIKYWSINHSFYQEVCGRNGGQNLRIHAFRKPSFLTLEMPRLEMLRPKEMCRFRFWQEVKGLQRLGGEVFYRCALSSFRPRDFISWSP